MNFDQFVTSYQHEVFLYLKKIVRDYQLAEDLRQETFLRAMKVLRRRPMPPHPRRWILRVARNLAFDKRRGETAGICSIGFDARRLDRLRASLVCEGEDPLANRALQEGMKKLSASTREILLRRYEGGMSCWEIAVRSGITEQSAKLRLYRGRKILKRFVDSRMRDPRELLCGKIG